MTEDRPQPPTLLYLIKQVELASRAGLDELTRPVGLTALQYTALTVLERQPGLTAAHLARNSFVTAQSMADMVTSLLRRGLVERNRDPKDRRRLVMSLTADGHRVLADLRPEVAALEARMLAELPPDAAPRLRELLEACRRGLDSRTPHDVAADVPGRDPELDHQVS